MHNMEDAGHLIGGLIANMAHKRKDGRLHARQWCVSMIGAVVKGGPLKSL